MAVINITEKDPLAKGTNDRRRAIYHGNMP
jgi:hypothetical protein